MPGPSPSPDETIDDLLHGELKLIQPRRGFRYAVDALLLADFARPLAQGQAVVDLGTGSGVVALIIAARGRPARVVGIELQEGLAAMARRNADLNATNPRVEIIHADAMTAASLLGHGTFGLAVTNPPFRRADSGRASPNPEKAVARHELAMSLGPWLGEGARLIRPDGSICIVYPVSELVRLERAVQDIGLHPARRRFAVDRPGGNRKLVLLELKKQPTELIELPDLAIETGQGKFSLDGYRPGGKNKRNHG